MMKQKRSKTARLVCWSLFVLLLWHMAQFVFPVYRMVFVDFEAMAADTGRPAEELQRKYSFLIRYNPRKSIPDDPAPWQILRMHPEWGAGDSPAWPKMDEYEMAVRARIISENTGEVVMTRFISGIPRKRYFICDGYRFPPGALGQDTTRPVIMISPAVMIMADRFEAEEVMYTRRWIDIDEVTDKYIDFVAME